VTVILADIGISGCVMSELILVCVLSVDWYYCGHDEWFGTIDQSLFWCYNGTRK